MIPISITGNVIVLGYAGENEARYVSFVYPEEWVTEFPNGTLEIHVKRAGDGAVYVAEETADDRENRTFTWTITGTDAAYAGNGEAQLCCIDDGKIVKSKQYRTRTEASVGASIVPEPPPPTVVEEAVNAYLDQYVDVITVSDHGEQGQILQSDGDGSYSWLTVTDPTVSTDTGNTLVPTRALNRLANVIREKTHYEGDMTVETMAEVMENTSMWTTEDYCMGIAPAAEELTLNFGTVPAYALYQRQNIAKVNLPYAARINQYAFSGAGVSEVYAPELGLLTMYTFYQNTAIGTVNFENLTIIDGINNFNSCSSLRTVNFPRLLYMSSSTFQACYSLVNAYLPSLVNTAGLVTTADNVFNACRSLEKIELPKFEGTMRTGWFDGCYNLREAILPKTYALTGNYNFRYCYRLTKIYAPELTNWGTQTFTSCEDLRRICIYKKPTTLSSTALNAPNLTDIYVPWSQGEVSGAPWGAPAGCTVHYNTVYDADGEPIV